MIPAFAHRLDEPSTAKALRIAVALDRVDAAALAQAGIPAWDAQLVPGRLTEAGELVAGTWRPEARAAYLTLLAQRDVPPTSPRDRLLQAMPEADRPRERALAGGVDVLGDAELLALLLRTGPSGEGVVEFAHRLLADHAGLIGLARLSIDELTRIDGLGPAKATELAAALALGIRLGRTAVREQPRLASPEEIAAAVLGWLGDACARMPHEELWCLPLDRRMHLIGGIRQVTRGDVDGTDAGPRAFFRIALASGAVGAIAVHNHPSGDPTPSGADHAVTRTLAAAGRTVEIPLIDHLVLGSGGSYVSLRRNAPELFR